MGVVAWIGLLLAGCDPGEIEANVGGVDTTALDTAPAPMATQGPDPSEAFAKPTDLTVTCSPTANALRFDCHVAVTPAQPVEVSFEKADGTGFVRVHTGDDAATDHHLTLYFLEPGTEYAWTAVATSWPDDPVVSDALITGSPPRGVPTRVAVGERHPAPVTGTWDPCADPVIATIFDASTGALLWYQEVAPSGALGRVDDVRFTEHHTVLATAGDRVVELDLLGDVLVDRESPSAEPVRSTEGARCAGPERWSPLEGW